MALCCDYNAGMLREPVTVQRKTRTADGAGGYTEAWSDVLSTRAHVSATSGTERWRSDRTEATTAFKVVMRYASNITEADCIVIRNRRHGIRFIDNIELKNRWLKIDADAGVAV